MTLLSAAAPLVAEFVGTFMLVFTVGCNVLSRSSAAWAPTSTACTLMVMTYCFGGVSGGHLNPAVTLAAALSRKIGWNQAFQYMVVQIGAGIVAGFCFVTLFQTKLVLGPSEPYGWWEVMIVETIYTAMLAFVVLSVTSSRNSPEGNPNQFYALAIGFVYVAGGYGAGPISGGAFNPAVSLGLDASGLDHIVYNGLMYTAFQAFGAVLAAGLFRLTRPEDFRPAEDPAQHRPALATQMASEFLGTFALALTVGLNVLAHSPATAWSAAASLTCATYALGDVSGGHFNPAVTLAVVLSGRGSCSPRQGGAYLLAQLVAGCLAGLLGSALHRGQTIALGPTAPYTDRAACIMEFVFTGVLAFVFLSTACAKGITSQLTRNYYFALAVGSCATAGGFAGGRVSGGSLNPAVSFGVVVPHLLGSWPRPPSSGGLYHLWTYCLAELAGGLAAATVFFVTHAKEYRKDKPILSR